MRIECKEWGRIEEHIAGCVQLETAESSRENARIEKKGELYRGKETTRKESKDKVLNKQ